ncbi:hypothetical protein KP509_33G067900 [Ceratopteris richardii]|uniref:C2H2-type domain-containing protein n=1 Tax=Ceratopteris richardii TaxID=49495 RepID=A0A8T2QS48_CERRI|nr:hypothetical protein KP509_33G067900 [Ceratopteris richardii]
MPSMGALSCSVSSGGLTRTTSPPSCSSTHTVPTIPFNTLAERNISSINNDNRRVSIFWDLDNKPPKSSPYHAALHLRRIGASFGQIVDMVACANRHVFRHIPRWLQMQENLIHSEPKDNHAEGNSSNGGLSPFLSCGVCGFTCVTKSELKEHARLVHRHNRSKVFNAFSNGGYSLHMELSRAGFWVRVVDQSPQAADRALKRQIKHSISNKVHCICLVSDDSDFTDILRAAQSKNVVTIVIGDSRSLHHNADIWFPWTEVADGLCFIAPEKLCQQARIPMQNSVLHMLF